MVVMLLEVKRQTIFKQGMEKKFFCMGSLRGSSQPYFPNISSSDHMVLMINVSYTCSYERIENNGSIRV